MLRNLSMKTNGYRSKNNTKSLRKIVNNVCNLSQVQAILANIDVYYIYAASDETFVNFAYDL